MEITYAFQAGRERHALTLIYVEGTRGQPYAFGEGTATRNMHVRPFFITKLVVTQALWSHVMDGNPAIARGLRKPVENVSWLDVAGEGGFLDTLNAGPIPPQLARQMPNRIAPVFRLPTESEWEYAARGGPRWRDGHRFSGSNSARDVGWFLDNSLDHTHEVGLKAPNQLGLHDMTGNVWEWCQDRFTRDVRNIPADGSAFEGEGEERVLRGGCFHNVAIHCTVSKRYEIAEDYKDGCIGFRMAVSGGSAPSGMGGIVR
jgi:formylglycine-generating enzyme required for sulfatase activity